MRLKDIVIKAQEGDPQAIAAIDRMERANKTKYAYIYDSLHSLYYGFSGYDRTDKQFVSDCHNKYRVYCLKNRYEKLPPEDFRDVLKVVSKNEYEAFKKDKGSTFKELKS